LGISLLKSKQQIPRGNDRKKSNGNGNDNSNSNSNGNGNGNGNNGHSQYRGLSTALRSGRDGGFRGSALCS